MAETVALKKVYAQLRKIEATMATRQQMNALVATIEILGTAETMKQIAESTEDIRKGRVKPISSVKNLFSEA